MTLAEFEEKIANCSDPNQLSSIDQQIRRIIWSGEYLKEANKLADTAWNKAEKIAGEQGLVIPTGRRARFEEVRSSANGKKLADEIK